jgi:menaquinone-dependent protoporphyrinogen oxidase
MRIAIIYLSRRGTTEKVARIIAEYLPGHSLDLYNMELNHLPELTAYDGIILGGPIYMGALPDKMQQYCLRNLDALRSRRLGLYICGMIPDPEKQLLELEKAYPTLLFQHAVAKAFLGGAFIQERMNFFEKVIVFFMARTRKSVEKIDRDAIRLFAGEFTRSL